MLFFLQDTASTETYPYLPTRSPPDSLPIYITRRQLGRLIGLLHELIIDLAGPAALVGGDVLFDAHRIERHNFPAVAFQPDARDDAVDPLAPRLGGEDRKGTRLNSSH